MNGIARGTLWGTAAATCLASAANAFLTWRSGGVGVCLPGLHGRYPARYGDLAYVVAGSGAPLLLLHGLDAGRSMAEWRVCFDLLTRHHTVYAFDFQGYGLSDKVAEGYTAFDFAEQISWFVRDIVGTPCAVMAAGDSAMLAALASRSCPLIENLVLVCPTTRALDEPTGEARVEALASRSLSSGLLGLPVWGRSAFNWNHRREAFRSWARRQGFYDDSLVEPWSRIWNAQAMSEGALHAQRALYRGSFAFDWRTQWEQTTPSALVIWGRGARDEGYDAASQLLAMRPGVELRVLERALLFPHIERSEALCQEFFDWHAAHPPTLNGDFQR